MEERGMTEDEAVELFKEAGRNTIFVSGHSIGSQMLVAGEFDVNATMYHHHTDRFPEDAPYEWEPPIEPIVIAPSGIGILRSLSLIHISEPTRLGMISYAVFCLK